jgi:hypothetical protein
MPDRDVEPLFDSRDLGPPTHIVDDAFDRRSRCGEKDPLPVVLAKFVQAHIDGWGMPVCPECAKGGWPTGDDGDHASSPAADP